VEINISLAEINTSLANTLALVDDHGALLGWLCLRNNLDKAATRDVAKVLLGRRRDTCQVRHRAAEVTCWEEGNLHQSALPACLFNQLSRLSNNPLCLSISLLRALFQHFHFDFVFPAASKAGLFFLGRHYVEATAVLSRHLLLLLLLLLLSSTAT